MNRNRILGLLIVVNVVLAVLLIFGSAASRSRADDEGTHGQQPISQLGTRPQSTAQRAATDRRLSESSKAVPSTPFTRIYSPDAKQFAVNLRRIGCPEATVKDILVDEINRRYRAQAEALRPKPADQVPFTWSANPSERKLLERRQQAAALAREKAALLRDTLGYEVAVELPVYAITSSEQRFEDSLATLPAAKRRQVASVQEDYWTRVQALQEHTKGFWQSEDVAALEQLKTERRKLIENLMSNP